MEDAADSFWNFSLALYARPEVAPACLALQDGHGVDVIIALYCCWVGASGRGLVDRAALAAAEDAARPWRQQVVEPLRRTRQALKSVAGAAAFYDRMKAIELDAERAAQARLVALAPAPDPHATDALRTAAARANLMLYVGDPAGAAAAPILAAL
jgi:uncharacterized protein (TIGR02444 family)